MAKKYQGAIAADLESFRKASTATAARKAELPAMAQGIASELAKRTAAAQTLNTRQDKLKADLKATTAALGAEIKAGRKLRTKLVRLAQVTFGSSAAEVGEFRAEG